MGYWWIVLTIFLFQPLFAAAPLDLEDAIKMAIRKNPEIKEQELLMGESEGQLEEAKAAQWPKLETLSYGAPMYEITGDALRSHDNTNEYGYFVKSEGKGYLPIYTWGKISNYKKAAQNKIIVDKNKTQETANEVVYKVKEYFYSYQLAWTLGKEAKSILDKLDKIIDKAEEVVKKETGEVTKVDVYKLRVFKAAGLQKYNKAETGKELARSALAMQIGLNSAEDFDTKRHLLKEEGAHVQPLETYVKVALERRPEMYQLKYGLAARNALVAAERANLFPMMALGMMYDVADSNVVKDQQSKFAYDPWNRVTGGVALAFKWDIDFLTTKAKMKQLKAKHDALLAKQEYAVRGIPMQVKKAYLSLREQEKNIEYANEGKKFAQKWSLHSGLGSAFGIGDIKDVLEGGYSMALMLNDYYQAIFNYNMALAELSKATGMEVSELKY